MAGCAHPRRSHVLIRDNLGLSQRRVPGAEAALRPARSAWERASLWHRGRVASGPFSMGTRLPLAQRKTARLRRSPRQGRAQKHTARLEQMGL